MPQVYPTDENVIFLACESIRQEAGGKLALLGYYPGNSILIPASTALPTQIQLACVYVLNDGEGEFDCKFRISLPTKKAMQEMALPIVNKQPNRTHTVTTNFVTFQVTEQGEFEFALILDDQVYERTISIRLVDEARSAD